jgi:hypothetical protein
MKIFAHCGFAVSVTFALGLAITASTVSAQAPAACPLKPEDISNALGGRFEAGQAAAETNVSGSIMRTCRYQSKQFAVIVKSATYANAAAAKGHVQMFAGKVTPIVGDADGAAIQDGQGDMTSPSVFYVRGNVGVELRVLGVYYDDLKNKDKALKERQAQLAKLPRFP